MKLNKDAPKHRLKIPPEFARKELRLLNSERFDGMNNSSLNDITRRLNVELKMDSINKSINILTDLFFIQINLSRKKKWKQKLNEIQDRSQKNVTITTDTKTKKKL